MAMEGEPKQAENFIGDAPFGFTPAAIQAHVLEEQQQLAQINASPEYLQGKFANFFKSIKERATGFLSVPPDEVLRILQEIYDFVHQAEEAGLDKSQILQKMAQEKPELFQAIIKFRGIMDGQVWGYRLSQKALAFYGKRSL